MANVTAGVYPVYKNAFKVSKTGAAGAVADMVEVRDMESFSVTVDGNIAEWNPLDQGGWTRRLMTAKSLTIKLSGKRNVGDPGNDYVADVAFKDGLECTTKAEWNFPSGAKLEFNAVINVTALGGESTDVDALEFELQSDGKPTYTPPASGGATE